MCLRVRVLVCAYAQNERESWEARLRIVAYVQCASIVPLGFKGVVDVDMRSMLANGLTSMDRTKTPSTR